MEAGEVEADLGIVGFLDRSYAVFFAFFTLFGGRCRCIGKHGCFVAFVTACKVTEEVAETSFVGLLVDGRDGGDRCA